MSRTTILTFALCFDVFHMGASSSAAMCSVDNPGACDSDVSGLTVELLQSRMHMGTHSEDEAFEAEEVDENEGADDAEQASDADEVDEHEGGDSLLEDAEQGVTSEDDDDDESIIANASPPQSEIEISGESSERSLLSFRETGRRRKGGGNIVNSAKKWIKSATKKAKSAVDSAIGKLKDESRTKGLLPSCMRDGKLASCVNLGSSASKIQKNALAAQKGLYSLKDCAAYASIKSSLKSIVAGVKCTTKTTLKYPTGVKTSWTPSVTMSSQDICTNVGGLNTNALKGVVSTFSTCAAGMFNAAAAELGSLTGIASGCACEADFGIYFGATVSAAAGVSGSISTGIIAGCDGCNFKFKPWWSWFGGTTSNVAVDGGFMVGVALTWDSFWGQALVLAASAGPNVVAANVGVGLSLPSLGFKTSTQKIEKKVCVSGKCVTIKKSLGGVPSGVNYEASQVGTVDFAITGGVSIIPVDVTSGFAVCYAIE